MFVTAGFSSILYFLMFFFLLFTGFMHSLVSAAMIGAGAS
jgi:hypothetical protein